MKVISITRECWREEGNLLSNAAGDLLFGSVATRLSEFVWNCKIVGGKLLFVQARQSKHVSLNSFSSKRMIFSVAWFLGLVEDYSLWES